MESETSWTFSDTSNVNQYILRQNLKEPILDGTTAVPPQELDRQLCRNCWWQEAKKYEGVLSCNGILFIQNYMLTDI